MTDAWLRAIVAFPFALVIGSFMTVVVARVPAGESLVRPRSRCPACGEQIRNRDNLPGARLAPAPRTVPGLRGADLRPLPGAGAATAVLIAGAFARYPNLWIAGASRPCSR